MKRKKNHWSKGAVLALAFCLLAQFPVYAEPEMPEYPEIEAAGAVVVNAADGEVLYGRNMNTKYYPASITKLVTAMLVLEHCSLDETVTFSKTATTNLESGAVLLGATAGDTLSVKDCLYALLLKSANEVGNGLAEHVSGSVAAFADLMNQKAESLGCANTHFANPHGLNDPNHYTTPYDMAILSCAAFSNPVLREINMTRTYKLPALKKYPAQTVSIGHKMMYPDDSRYYEGIIGGKTGYTSLAGNTLVTAAERDGVRLVAVVMKANGTHYTDTKALLDYGFEVMKIRSQQTPVIDALETGTPETGVSAGQPLDQAAVTGSQASGQIPGIGGSPDVVLEGPGENSGSLTILPDARDHAEDGVSMGAPGTDAAGLDAPSEAVPTVGWKQNTYGWYYSRDDGSYVVSEWLNLSDGTYWIDSTGYMARGWEKIDGEWYYFRSGGAMAVDRWEQDGGKWFYLGSDGKIMKNGVTPDGYAVGPDGAWIVS